MKKQIDDNGMIIYTPDWKAITRLSITWFVILVLCGVGIGVTLASIQPKQMIYEKAVEEYNKQHDVIIEARTKLLTAKKELAIEKMSEAKKVENWNEVARLTDRLKDVESEIANKSLWVVFQ